MILWRIIENYPFYHFDSDPRFPPFLLYMYVRWKSGVTFVRRCFRDVKTWKPETEKCLRVNIWKTKILVSGVNLDLPKKSGNDHCGPCGVCQIGVGSKAIVRGGCLC